MNTLVALLPFAGCAAMMVVCARMMTGGHKAHSSEAPEAAEVDRLRSEVAELRARLDAPDSADRAARN